MGTATITVLDDAAHSFRPAVSLGLSLFGFSSSLYVRFPFLSTQRCFLGRGHRARRLLQQQQQTRRVRRTHAIENPKNSSDHYYTLFVYGCDATSTTPRRYAALIFGSGFPRRRPLDRKRVQICVHRGYRDTAVSVYTHAYRGNRHNRFFYAP